MSKIDAMGIMVSCIIIVASLALVGIGIYGLSEKVGMPFPIILFVEAIGVTFCVVGIMCFRESFS